MPLSARCRGTATGHGVDAGRHEKHDTGDDELGARLEADEPHPVVDHGDQRTADHGVLDSALAAEEAGAADDRGTDGVEQRVATAEV